VTAPTRFIQPAQPPAAATAWKGVADVALARTEDTWEGAALSRHDAAVRVTTGAAPWSYAAVIPIDVGDRLDGNGWWWADLTLSVVSGQVGLSIMAADGQLKGERLVRSGPRRVRIALSFSTSDAAILIRNGSQQGPSVVDLRDLRVCGMPPSAGVPAGGTSTADAFPVGSDDHPGASARPLVAALSAVYQLADHSTVDGLDHLELIGPHREEAFVAHTRGLHEHAGGYQCSGMSLYLSHVLERDGYRTLTYNSGVVRRSHVVTLAESAGRLYLLDPYLGTMSSSDGQPLPFDHLLKKLLQSTEVDYMRMFAPVEAGGRKSARIRFAREVDWSRVTDEDLNEALDRTEWPSADARLEIVGRTGSGPSLLAIHDDEEALIADCRIVGRVLHGMKSYTRDMLRQTYGNYDRRLRSITGVDRGTFLLPLNLHSDHLDAMLAAYPFLGVLNRHCEDFRRLADGTDPQRTRDVSEAFRCDLLEALRDA
jgi:hypothetical protein